LEDISDYELRTLRVRARRLVKVNRFDEAIELYNNALDILRKKGDKKAINSFESFIFKLKLEKLLYKVDELLTKLDKIK